MSEYEPLQWLKALGPYMIFVCNNLYDFVMWDNILTTPPSTIEGGRKWRLFNWVSGFICNLLCFIGLCICVVLAPCFSEYVHQHISQARIFGKLPLYQSFCGPSALPTFPIDFELEMNSFCLNKIFKQNKTSPFGIWWICQGFSAKGHEQKLTWPGNTYIYIYTTWKVDGATPMYWFITAPYQSTFWEMSHLLSLRYK